LRFESQAVDRPADVDCAHAALDSIAAVAGYAHFHRVRGIAAECEMTGDPEPTTARHATTPADALCRETQHASESTRIERRSAVLLVLQFTRLAKQAKAEGEGILLRGMSDFVEETLHGEGVRSVRGRAPRAARDAGVDRKPFHSNVVEQLRREVTRIELGSPHVLGLHIRPAVVLRCARETVRPARELSISIESRDQ